MGPNPRTYHTRTHDEPMDAQYTAPDGSTIPAKIAEATRIIIRDTGALLREILACDDEIIEAALPVRVDGQGELYPNTRYWNARGRAVPADANVKRAVMTLGALIRPLCPANQPTKVNLVDLAEAVMRDIKRGPTSASETVIDAHLDMGAFCEEHVSQLADSVMGQIEAIARRGRPGLGEFADARGEAGMVCALIAQMLAARLAGRGAVYGAVWTMLGSDNNDVPIEVEGTLMMPWDLDQDDIQARAIAGDLESRITSARETREEIVEEAGRIARAGVREGEAHAPETRVVKRAVAEAARSARLKIRDARDARDAGEVERLEVESFEAISEAVASIPDHEMAEHGELYLDAGDWWFRSPPE